MRKNKFQTIVDVPDFGWQTGYQNKTVFMGSCFTENVGQKMEALKYPVDINPFGILYNPVSVGNGLKILLEEKQLGTEDLIQRDGMWHSFFHHGRFSAEDATECAAGINNRIQQSGKFLKEASFLFLTFGTAWVYRYNKTNAIVSNCHKIPACEFSRQRIEVDEIVTIYKELLPKLWAANPNLKVVFTVSPIRHWKDGAIENQRSKATLLLAIDKLTEEFGKERCAYFPSYEIVMDELRDYRFYAADMLHLTEVAVQHIWEVFEESLIDTESRKASKEVQKIVNAAAHRPINAGSEAHYTFLTQCLRKIEALQTKLPYLNFKLEMAGFHAQIEKIERDKI